MKKITIVVGLISMALIILWILFAVLYWLFSNQPKVLPKGWNIALGVPFATLLSSAICLAISERKLIISEINLFIKNTTNEN